MFTPLEEVADISAKEARHFTVLDAMKPYQQCPLNVKSHTLTTFITLFGHFKYLRAPYGLSTITDHSNYHIVEVCEGLLGYLLPFLIVGCSLAFCVLSYQRFPWNFNLIKQLFVWNTPRGCR